MPPHAEERFDDRRITIYEPSDRMLIVTFSAPC
jgi:hypothetical protein